MTDALKADGKIVEDRLINNPLVEGVIHLAVEVIWREEPKKSIEITIVEADNEKYLGLTMKYDADRGMARIGEAFVDYKGCKWSKHSLIVISYPTFSGKKF